MNPDQGQTAVIQGWINRLLAGDETARPALLEAASRRLSLLARRMLRDFPRVARWEETDDILQRVLMRLHKALESVVPPTALEFFRLSATVTRRELIGLARHYYGPHGLGAHHSSVGGFADQGEDGGWVGPSDASHDPGQLELWSEFHRQVEALDEVDREVFDLLWYQELSQTEAAVILRVDERTVRRRWSAARRRLYDALDGRVPG